jgi:hypothetical protein
MSIGLIFGGIVIAGLAVWAVMLLRSRIVGRRTEASSFSESGAGSGSGDTHGHGGYGHSDGGGGHGGGD